MFKKIFTTMLFVFTSSFTQTSSPKGNYASVNGLKMYYEIHLPDVQAGGDNSGTPPLILIHGGGSTITTTFGTILPMLAKHRIIVAVELQGHGHTSDRNSPESFEQDADDVATLLQTLAITQADFLGFSNGGNTAIQIAVRHSEIVHKLILASTFYKREGLIPGFFDGMKQASLAVMPQLLKDAFLQINPDTNKLLAMFNKDKERMLRFKDWREETMSSIKAPTFIINGDRDVILADHALAMSKLISNSRLMILPAQHGSYIGVAENPNPEKHMIELTVPMIEEFLDAPMPVEDSTRREKK
ncbi:MAG: alpha/beta hydrolase [Bacteroidota bacterium]